MAPGSSPEQCSFPLQTVSVSVSVLTLSCIALDRWYAICHPLMFKSTAKRARNSIVIIWIVSCIIMIPQAIVMECSSMLPGLANKTTLFTVCDEHWGGKLLLMSSHWPGICKYWISITIAKLGSYILLVFVKRTQQKGENKVEAQHNFIDNATSFESALCTIFNFHDFCKRNK